MASKDFWNLSIIYNFMRLAELENVTKASVDLYITQPALSHQLSKLETDLNVQLFNRNKTGVTLTDKGQEFYAYCKELLDNYDTFISKAYSLGGSTLGRISIGYTASSKPYVFRIGQQFLDSYPEVVIKNTRQSQKNHLDMLLNGELDLAFVHSYDIDNLKSKFRTYPVCVLENMALVSVKSPLASKKSLRIEDLKDYSFVFPDPSIHSEKINRITQRCREAGFTPAAANYYFQIADYLMELRTNTRSVTIIPYMASTEEQNPDLIYIPLEDFFFEDQIYLTWTNENPNPIVPLYVRSTKAFISRGAL